jgi:hypothetical protein
MRGVFSFFVLAGLCVLAGCGGSGSSGSNPSAPNATNTVLTATPNPVAPGANVTLSATVSSAGGMPSGNVAFLDGTTTLGTVPLSNGIASLTLNTFAAGTTHSIAASYAGSSNYATSTSASVALVVNAPSPVATTTVLAATPNPVAAAATVTLNATITSLNTTETPTGSVSFNDGTTLLGSSTLAPGTGLLNTGLAVSTRQVPSPPEPRIISPRPSSATPISPPAPQPR